MDRLCADTEREERVQKGATLGMLLKGRMEVELVRYLVSFELWWCLMVVVFHYMARNRSLFFLFSIVGNTM